MTFLAGMETHFATKTVIVAGQPVKGSVIIDAVHAQLTALTAATTAKTAWLHAVQQQRTQYESVLKPYIAAVRHYAAVMFGTNTPEYQDFGFSPPKKAAKTAINKVKAVLQNAATRVARHTMGPKERLQVRGTVAPEAITQAFSATPSTPAVAPSTPAATAPSSTAANGTTPPSGSTGQSH
jgi:hypothetical protein